MNWWRGMALLLSSTLVGATFLPCARADAWDKKTILTFNESVEVPGQVLQPGTYVFKLMDSPSNRNVVQIFDKDGMHLYATILAIPDYRLQPADEPLVMFDERPSGSPEAIRAWFYPGDNYGQAFVYPRSRALALARATNQTVPTTTSEASSNLTAPATSSEEAQEQVTNNAEVKSVGPSGDEADISQQGTAQPQSSTEMTQQGTAQPQPSEPEKPASELPKTASPVPLVAVIGLLLVVAAGSLREVLKRTS